MGFTQGSESSFMESTMHELAREPCISWLEIGMMGSFGWFLTETQQSLALKKFKHLGNVQYEAYTFR